MSLDRPGAIGAIRGNDWVKRGNSEFDILSGVICIAGDCVESGWCAFTSDDKKWSQRDYHHPAAGWDAAASGAVYLLRSWCLRSLPLGVRGSSSTKSKERGTL